MKVLLVDDSEKSRDGQRAVLTQLGFGEIVEARDGKEALERLGGFSPDLIVVDRGMPEMDVLTFVRVVRQSDKATPIILVTTESGRERVVEAIKAGVSDYLVKPFTPDVLSQRVEETMAKAGAA